MYAVAITAMGFNPQPLTVPLNASVQWTNADSIVHTVVFDAVTPGTPFSGNDIPPSASQTCVFEVAGTYTYHDRYNPRMTGEVTVTP